MVHRAIEISGLTKRYGVGDAAVDALIADPSVPMSTVVHPADPDALDDPNRVKVVMDLHGRALYFSRSRIPYVREGASMRMWQHVGLYAYRREFLLQLAALPRAGIERIENLEQLRVLDAGHSITCGVIDEPTIGIDTPEDYRAFVERWRSRDARHAA